jgi:NAD(P)-dependent dehydrogenase (short-subunit alcohol dehydrogenase family)
MEFGSLHAAIACAGVGFPGLTLTSKGSLDMEIYKNVIGINLFGSVHVAKFAALAMSRN